MYAKVVGAALVLAGIAVALFGLLNTLPYVIAVTLFGLSSVVFNLESVRSKNQETYNSLDQLRRELYQAEKRQADKEKARRPAA